MIRAKGSRTRLRRRELDDYNVEKKTAAPWVLCLDDAQGNGQQHGHGDEGAHEFPMTRNELLELRAQITVSLMEPA